MIYIPLKNMILLVIVLGLLTLTVWYFQDWFKKEKELKK